MPSRATLRSTSAKPTKKHGNRKPPAGPHFWFTRNGKPLPPPVPAPKRATDVHVVWDPMRGVIVAAWWTIRGIPGPRIPVPRGANDWHFALRPGLPPMPPMIPPPGVDDIEIHWDGDRIVEVWWTRWGRPVKRVPLSADSAQFNVRVGGMNETAP